MFYLFSAQDKDYSSRCVEIVVAADNYKSLRIYVIIAVNYSYATARNRY